MSVPLFVSERAKPKITTQPLSVGCLIFERMDHQLRKGAANFRIADHPGVNHFDGRY